MKREWYLRVAEWNEVVKRLVERKESETSDVKNWWESRVELWCERVG